MKIKMIGLILVFLVGCTRPAPAPTELIIDETLTKISGNSYGKAVLPDNAKNIKDIGNGWCIFELEIEGWEQLKKNLRKSEECSGK